MKPRIPEGTRIFAIGDIHGQLQLLDRLLERFYETVRNNPADRTILIALGDMIDRGPDSPGVLDRMIALSGDALCDASFECVCLKGNHEDAMLRFMLDGALETGRVWLANGGDTTCRDYGVDVGSPSAPELARIAAELRVSVPAAHVDFMRGLKLDYVVGDYLFVHAGIRPGRPLDRQDPYDLMWIRDEFLRSREDFGKTVVHGHTPVAAPEIHRNRIALDTGAGHGRGLTAMFLDAETRLFMTATPSRRAGEGPGLVLHGA